MVEVLLAIYFIAYLLPDTGMLSMPYMERLVPIRRGDSVALKLLKVFVWTLPSYAVMAAVFAFAWWVLR